MIRHPVLKAGLVLGLGLGGFLDGTVLHQILGWHHLICTTATCAPDSIATLQRQNIQDGFFHLATWLFTVSGIVLACRAQSRLARDSVAASSDSGKILCGGSIAGWGAFNFFEGLIDHQLLGLHHVKPDSPHWFAYDLAFLGSGVVLWLVGLYIAQSPSAPTITR